MAKSKITPLPSLWLTKEEKAFAYNAFFEKKEKAALEKYSQINQKLLKKAKAIVIDLIKPDGYLGDTIRDSRLTEVIIKNYPEKQVFEWSSYPEILGKHPFVVKIERKPQKVIINYCQTQDVKQQKVEFEENEVLRLVKISPRFSGAFPAAFFNQKYGQSVLFHQIPLHHLHVSQIVWEKLYLTKSLTSLPLPSIKVSKANQQKAKNFFKTLGLNQKNTFCLIIHPDAHDLHFKHKAWPTLKWIELVKDFKKTSPRIKVFLTTGVNHPQVTKEICQACQKQKIPLVCFPVFSLSQYVALLELFPQAKTVFLGLESMAASHLAPSLGFKSVVVGSDAVFNPLIYGPFGGMVVTSNDHKTSSVSVEAVRQAVKLSFKSLA